MSIHRNPYFLIHLCVLLWGFTAILGKLITLSAIPLVFWRVLIVSLCLFFWLPVWRQLVRMTRRDLGITVLNGAVITVHWLFFYGAIKAANASVAATCLALAPVFLSIIEPLWRKQAFVARDLLIAVIAMPGVALVVGGIPSGMMVGLSYGVMAALLAAIFSLISKGLAMRVPALCLTTVQMTTGTVMLGLLIPFWPMLGDGFSLPQQQDLVWLIILAIACTLVPFTLTNVALRKISAFSVQLAVNLEPVYTILLAAILLVEAPNWAGRFIPALRSSSAQCYGMYGCTGSPSRRFRPDHHGNNIIRLVTHYPIEFRLQSSTIRIRSLVIDDLPICIPDWALISFNGVGPTVEIHGQIYFPDLERS